MSGHEPAPEPATFDVLGATLADIASRLSAHCLVETEDGAVVAHALLPGPAPEHVVDAVLRRTIRPLVDASRTSRRSSPLPGGPLIVGPECRGDGWIHVAPLVRGGRRIGSLWLIGPRRLPPETIAAELVAVAAGLPAAPPDPQRVAVAAATAGGHALPREWVRAARSAWVVTLSGRPPQDLRPALTTAPDGLRLLAVDHGERTRAVVLDDRGMEARQVEARVQKAVARAELVLGRPLRAGMSEPSGPLAPIGTAVQQADAAWLMSASGRCTPLRDVRSRYVLHLAREALHELPDLGPDPVLLLREHDRSRTTDLCRTVRAWLDAGRDVAAAADSLFLHPNTLRYRLRKAQAVMGRSLEDVDLQIDLHLRLGPDVTAG